MSDLESPWPERERTQVLLVGAGALFLVPATLAASGLLDLFEFGGAVVVSTAVATALLIYGLLGWGGNVVAEVDTDSEDDGNRYR